jgi:hypothetical protein
MQNALKTFVLSALILVPAAFAPLACGGGGTTTTSTGTGGSASTSTSTSSSSGTGTGGTGVTATKACDDEAAAVCTLRSGCGATGYEIGRNYGTEALCQSRTAQSCINSLDATGQGNTPANTETCAAAYPSEACTDFFDSNPVAACVPPAGTQATGAACGASGQCTSTWCAVTSTTVCGTCQPLPAPGATCLVQADCGRDLACATPTVTLDGGVPTSGLCAAWVASGGACLTGYNPCQEGLSCVGDDETTMVMGTCQTAGATVGAACQTTHKTGPTCADGLVCIITQPATNSMGTCQAITLVGAGKPCGDLGGTTITSFAACNAGGLCQKAAPNDATGTCVATAADNAACDNDPSIGPPCLAPSKCVVPAGSAGTAGTCTFPNAATCN